MDKVEYYYYFDCMNAVLGDRLWAASAFEGDQDAIKTAANYDMRRPYTN